MTFAMSMIYLGLAIWQRTPIETFEAMAGGSKFKPPVDGGASNLARNALQAGVIPIGD